MLAVRGTAAKRSNLFELSTKHRRKTKIFDDSVETIRQTNMQSNSCSITENEFSYRKIYSTGKYLFLQPRRCD